MSDVSGDNSREFVDRALVKDEALMPVILTEAWKAYGDHRKIVSLRNISANVSTNSVYLLGLSDGHEFVAKTSTYGSYVHFRQDHRIIQQWIRRLAPTRYRDFLAGMWTRDDEVFFHRIGDEWIVFYDKTPFYDFLPKILCEAQVVALGEEMASFHRASAQVAPLLGTSWKSLGSDVATLHDHLGSAEWRNERGFSDELEHTLRAECDKFFVNAEKLGYHRMQKIPILMDWNIGNFSVGMNGDGFRLFSRWDYDWFRVEPRTLDFYFCARVVRADGDQDTFSYTVAPFFEERFFLFLRSYHAVYSLTPEDVLFLKEAYRFFLLNYVIRSGEHFFRPQICRRLQKEAVEGYFADLERTDFAPMLRELGL